MDTGLNSNFIHRGSDGEEKIHPLPEKRETMKDLLSLSGREALERILEHENPERFVRAMSPQDLFWLIKKIGEDDSLPILELASREQWQYLLDLEIWRKDRISIQSASQWLRRFLQADSKRLLNWLTSEDGEPFTFFYFYKNIQVEIRPEEGPFDPKEGSFTLDGKFYINILNQEEEETIRGILEELASEDFVRYHALLIMLSGVIPSQLEEELFRWRNVRLSEHGFMPFDEALIVYSPMDPRALETEEILDLYDIIDDGEVLDLVPVSPFIQIGKDSMLQEACSRIEDPVFMERISLEFSALCNLIISADGLQVQGFEDLVKTARKASGFLNIALERISGGDITHAQRIVRDHPLLSLFRVGFGLALRLKWEVEAWLKDSWFRSVHLGFEFWGQKWGKTMEGLLFKRPKLYSGFEEGEEYRDFERLSELDECRKILNRLKAMDMLLKVLGEIHPLEREKLATYELTFHVLLFNLWSRYVLKIEPSFAGISMEEARRFLRQLRGRKRRPPYLMRGFEEKFVEFYLGYARDWEAEFQGILKETLSIVWHEFEEEYRWISEESMDRKYMSFIGIKDS